MSRKKIAVIIAGVMAVVLLGAGLWAVVAHNNRAKALEEATDAYTKAGTALEGGFYRGYHWLHREWRYGRNL